MKKKPTIAVYTLGCRTNQFDSEAVFSQFRRHGYERLPQFSRADVHLVNTCTVTNRGENKSRSLIRKILRMKNGLVIATGCSAQQDPGGLAELGAHLVVDNANKMLLYKHYIGSIPHTIVTSDIRRLKTLEQTPIKQFGSRARAHLKIQDGCNRYCSYCIIPHVRGRSRSLAPGRLFSQLDKLIRSRYREIVLTGIHIGDYRSRHLFFPDILAGILERPGNFRVRLSAIEPGEISLEVIQLFRRYPRKLCRHLHIAVQSGSDDVLKRMRRRYDRALMEKLFSDLFKIDSNFGIGIDVMTGFPGESQREFEQTLRLIELSPVSYGHVFRFSPKKGTPAAKYQDQVPEAVKKERSQALRRLLDEKQDRFLKMQAFTVQEAVFETAVKGLTGNYTRISIADGKACAGESKKVKLLSGFTRLRNEKFPVVDAVLAP